MCKFGLTAVSAGLIGGAMLLLGTAAASATTLPGPGLAAPGGTALVEEVRHNKREHARRYEPRRHGNRHRHARSGYRHYHGGYYYASPWWIGPSIGFGLTLPTASGHVQWCYDRYRSYDAASDSYMGYDGLRHRCNSPY